jgi:hypothetical protein
MVGSQLRQKVNWTPFQLIGKYGGAYLSFQLHRKNRRIVVQADQAKMKNPIPKITKRKNDGWHGSSGRAPI